MTVSSFQPFGPDHMAVLALTFVAGLALVLGARRIRRIPDDWRLRYGLAFLLTAVGLSSWIFDLARRGFVSLPLQLCDLALILVIWTLIRPQDRYVGEIASIWALAGSSQAVLTPDLTYKLPNLSSILFFLAHCGVVLSAVYLMVRGHVSLRPASVWRVWLLSNGYAAVAGLANWLLGTNFGYLARKPAQPSLLDHLGPWPYYILWGEFVVLGLLFVCYALSRILERWASRPAA